GRPRRLYDHRVLPGHADRTVTPRSLRALLASGLAVFLAAPPAARAAEVSVGVGLGVAADMPDRVSSEHTRFPFAPGLHVPVRIDLSEGTRLRIDGRLEGGRGGDRVSW